MDIEITFPGGKKVDASFGGFLVNTDQSELYGGEGNAPEPFSLFLVSLGTCAGVYVAGFCQNRNIPTEGIKLFQRHETDPETNMLSKITIEIQVPTDFPEKYHPALVRSAEKCSVKRVIENSPVIEAKTVVI